MHVDPSTVVIYMKSTGTMNLSSQLTQSYKIKLSPTASMGLPWVLLETRKEEQAARNILHWMAKEHFFSFLQFYYFERHLAL